MKGLLTVVLLMAGIVAVLLFQSRAIGDLQNDADTTVVKKDRIVPGDITFEQEPPGGYRKVGGWDTMVLMNDAGDSFFVWWAFGELWQVAPPWCEVVVERRIVQLEMALAQAHAHADSLEVLAGIGGGD